MALFCIFLSACTGSFEPGALLNSPSNSDKPATIDSVTIKDKSLVIKGKQLNAVKKISIEGVSQTFQIDSQTTEEIQTSVSSSLQLIAYKSYKLILSTASAETIAAVALITLTLDTFGASEGQVLKFNSTTQTWEPGDFNGLHFIGSWDTSANSNPYIISGGYGDSSSPKAGDYYIVSTSATITAIDSHTDWGVGDWIVFGSDNKWHKLASDGGVKSFKGRTGAVTPQSGDYNLSQLGDIDLSGVTSNSILKWNSTSSKWVVGADNTSGAGGAISGSSVSVNNAGGTGGFSTSATSTDLEGNADLILRSDSDASSSGDVVFKRGTTESMRLTSTGLGVGTTNPSAKLEVNGGHFLIDNSSPQTRFAKSGSLKWSIGAVDGSTDKLHFYEEAGAGSEGYKMTIDTSGNIGVGTASPSEKLDIGSGNIGFVSGTSRITWNDGGLNRSYIQRTRTDGDYFTIANNNSASGIQLGTQDGTNPFSPKVTMTSAGNVGVGTTAPASKFHVADSSSLNVRLETTDPGVSTGSFISFVRAGTAKKQFGLEGSDALSLVQGSGSDDSAANRMYVRFLPDGNTAFGGGSVGIRTSSPRAAIDINGTILGKSSTLNGTATIDFSAGNIQHTISNCGAFNLHNLKDGGTYIFIVKGTTSATCSFSVYSDGGSTALTPHLPPDHGATIVDKHTLYNILVSGSDVYFSWIPGY